MKYVQPFDQPTVPLAPYVNLNAAAGIDGSIPPAKFFNDTQWEILNVIIDAGLTPDGNDQTQLLQAINKRLNSMTILPVGAQFYVNASTGSDGNTGLSAGAAFATIQGAINAISAKYITLGAVTVNVANGTYAGFTISSCLVGSWNIVGNTANPALVSVSAATTAVNTGRGAVINRFVTATIDSVTFTSYAENVANGGFTVLKNVKFNAPSSAYPTIGAYAGETFLFGSCTYAGAGTYFVSCSAKCSFGYDDGITPQTLTFTASGTPSFSGAFASVTYAGQIIFYPARVTFGGSATGPRYLINLYGFINTQGSGATYLPGDSAGSTFNGGVYF